MLCHTSDSQHLPKEAWSYLHQCGCHPTTAKAAYTILVFLAQREAHDTAQDIVWDMLSPSLYDDQSRLNSRTKNNIWRLAKQMQYQIKLFSVTKRYGVVVTDPEQIAQEIVQNISSTMTQGSATEEECSLFLDSFFARHSHQQLYRMLSKQLTYNLVHAALGTLNRGSAWGLDGFGPRMIRIIQDFESTGSRKDNWSVALFNPIPKTVGISTLGDL